MIYDIIILGSGPAGLTAALYGARTNKKVLILGGHEFGGQTAGIPKLENYPGFTGTGMELCEFIKNQAESFGADLVMGHITKVEKTGTHFIVHAEKEKFEAKAVIIATGASPRKLEIIGAKEFTGKGVSYCATCDGSFCNDKIVAVYGGGNSALNDALYLAGIAKKVYIIYRKPAFTRTEEILVKRINETKNIECIFDTEIESLEGNNSGLTTLLIRHKQGAPTKMPIDGLFVAIGHEANTDFLSEEFKRDGFGKLVSEPNSSKIIDGLFVAGDVRSGNKMQICIATGWGCEAAMDATAYLNKMKIE